MKNDYSKMSDIELINGFIANDLYAGDALIKRHYDPLRRFLVFKQVPAKIVEDITQETFLKVLKALRQGLYNSEKAEFRTWLFTIGWRTFISYTRENKIKTYESPNLEFDPLTMLCSSDNIVKEFEDKQRSYALKKAILELSEELANVAMIHWFVGKSLQKTAEILEIPLGTVKSRAKIVKRELAKQSYLFE